MIVVRQEQLDRLTEALTEGLVCAHLRELFPEHCQTLDMPLAHFARSAIRTAHAYGFEETPHLCRFAAIALIFGAGFDAECTWAAAVLNDARLTDPRKKIAVLHRRAMQALEPVPFGEHS